MNQKYNLTVSDVKFEDRVHLMADEVLKILKELSRENKASVDSKSIAEKMIWRDSVKKVLTDRSDKSVQSSTGDETLKEVSNALLDKLTELVPSFMTDQLSELKEKMNNNTGDSQKWLDSPIKFIKQHISSISARNNELEAFMQQTVQYLAETEVHIAGELSSHHIKFNNDRDFEKTISDNVFKIKTHVGTSNDLSSVKTSVMSTIESINKAVQRKREQDIAILKQNEAAFEDLGRKMSEVKREAEDIKRKSEEIEYESLLDPLTRLCNRRAYDQKMLETIANLDRYDVQSSLLVCDIDFFKKINDNFGHKVGDLALKKLAALLKERLRVNDFIARYGGEEFVIILPHVGIDGAAKAAEGIRSYIDKSTFSYKGQKIPLTISVGASAFKKGEAVTQVFEKADKALYLAKRSGRNTVKTEVDVIHEGAALNPVAR